MSNKGSYTEYIREVCKKSRMAARKMWDQVREYEGTTLKEDEFYSGIWYRV